MVPLSMTLIDLDWGFKVAILFDIEYLRNDTRYRHSYYKTSIGSLCALSNVHIFNDLDRALNRFSRSRA